MKTRAVAREADPDASAVDLAGVTRSFGNVEALREVSIRIRTGERVALIGPSGAGKTTLLKIMAGSIQPTSGNVRLFGKAVEELQSHGSMSLKVGLLHQQLDLIPQLSVRNNVEAGRLGQWSLARAVVGLMLPFEDRAAREAVRRVGLEERYRIRLSRLSGGEQQRVAIARLLVQDPEIFLADEPVASLDPELARAIMELLARLATEGRKTLVASVHLADLARLYFDRVLGIRAGRLVFDVPAGELSSSQIAGLYDISGRLGGSGYVERGGPRREPRLKPP